MRVTHLLTDDRAASDVVGTILMVAVTVVLAAVIGTFVLGLVGPSTTVAPQAVFTFDFDSDANVTITHESGETIPVEDTLETHVSEGSFDAGDDDWEDLESPVETGTAVTLTHLEGGHQSAWDGETVSLVWVSADGETSAVVGEATAPKN
jgi:flagellin-like protein